MLYLYVDLRYHRQLNKICHDIPVRFFSTIDDSVRKNGGAVNRIGSGMLYSFDEKSTGFVFSASRVIDDLKGLLEKMRERIREYCIIVDAVEGHFNLDSFKERLYQYSSEITPDEGILFTSSALSFLRPYVATVPLTGSSFELYSGPRVREYAISKQEPDEPQSLSVYIDSPIDTIKMLWDMVVASAPEMDIQNVVNDADRESFEENIPALDVYSWHRFSSKQPEYRRDAVFALFAQQLLTRTKILGGPVPVTVIGNQAVDAEFVNLTEKLAGLCRFSVPKNPLFLPADAASMPPDLLDMAYLVYRSLDYLYYQELSSFFKFLDKDASFIGSLGSWLYSYGILSDPGDFRSVNLGLKKQIIHLCGIAKKSNDRKIADFLWLKYESGLLMPTMDLLAVFNDLEFPLSDSFLVSCFFYSDNHESKQSCLEMISVTKIRSAIKQLTGAEKSFDAGDLAQAENHTRDVLHFFQKEKIVYGEFRAFSLLSQLSLARNKGGDSIAYLEYALENAVQSRDAFSVLDTNITLACVHFGVGSFDFSLSCIENAEKNARSCYAKDRQAKILFIKGRLYFEIGDYLNSGLFFQAASVLASSHQFNDVLALSRVWYARVLSHEGKYHGAVQILTEYQSRIHDAACFRIELAILSGHPVSDIFFPESLESNGFKHSSGFSMIEDRFITVGSAEFTAQSLFRLFSLYHRARFEGEDSVMECLASIEELARAAYDRNDAYAGLYYFLCFELARYVPELSHSDGTGYLSRGFKYLQKKAKEITNNSIREQFLRNPVWNSRIFRAARENMLI